MGVLAGEAPLSQTPQPVLPPAHCMGQDKNIKPEYKTLPGKSADDSKTGLV